MKKLLLATTTLIGSAGLLSGAALADTPKVTIGGYENVEWGQLVNDDLDGGQRAYALRNDTEVDVKIDGKSDAGLGYGGEIDLLADVSPDQKGRGANGGDVTNGGTGYGNASKTFIYLDGVNWGRFELGSNVGADTAMNVDAGTIARATGGIDGDFNYFMNAATQYLAKTELPLAYGRVGGGIGNTTGDFTEENVEKLTYYTPRFAGFQVGVSFLPDQINRGQGNNGLGTINNGGPTLADETAGLSQDIWTGGISYDTKYRQVGLAASATGEFGQHEVAGYRDLAAWEGGAKATLAGFSLAGSYGSWGRSNTLNVDNSKDTWYWDVGGAYEMGPFGASVTYMHSNVDCGTGGVAGATGGINGGCAAVGNNKFRNVSVGTDYKLAPGLTPYAEVSFYDENPEGAGGDDKGAAVIVGTQLNF